MVSLTSISELDQEFQSVLNSMNAHHSKMRDHVNFYKHSAFYPARAGDVRFKQNFGLNLLRAFANKNINYTATFPGIKVPHIGIEPDERERCSTIEKIVYATHEANQTKTKQSKWAQDGTVMSEAFAMVDMDFKSRNVRVRRIDPRFAYYQFSNDNDERLVAFWLAYRMTAEQIMAQYGVEPTSSGITPVLGTLDGNDTSDTDLDDKNRFWVIVRVDDRTRVAWAGEHFLEKPHMHLMPGIPVFRCAPFDDADLGMRGDFFMDDLLSPQAEINETLRRKVNLIRKMGNPTVWARGVIASQFDEIKKVTSGEGGFVGLKREGEIGLLKIDGLQLFDDHVEMLFQKMKDISGFSTATFGENIGANTSGDALDMYFQPTSQSSAKQWGQWTRFYEGINEFILRCWELMLLPGEKKSLYGMLPRTTWSVDIDPTTEQKTYRPNQRSYKVEFDADTIGGYYRTVIIPPAATPKNDVSYKNLLLQADGQKTFPKSWIYEEWGDISPEDTLNQLKQEQEDPALNPEGVASLLQAEQTANTSGAANAVPTS